MIDSARRQAIDVLLDQRLFALDSERYDAFMHALDNPPAPGPKLRSLLRRVPAWRKLGNSRNVMPRSLSDPGTAERRTRLFGVRLWRAGAERLAAERALKNESRFSRTYVVCEGARVVAYFCIAAGAVERASAPGKVRRNAPDTIPVSVIGRLAVSREHAGRGLGADILADALRRIALASQSIGIGAVLVHAKDDAAKRFYMRCAEFIEYPADSRTLFLPIETVVAAFG